jgi:hypothetical protein
MTDSLVQEFHSNGYATIEGVIGDETIARLYAESIRFYDEMMCHIQGNSVPLGIGVKEGYKEIVQRHTNRFEISIDSDEVLKELYSSISNDQLIQELPRLIFPSSDFHIVNKSIVISLPGAMVQYITVYILFVQLTCVFLGPSLARRRPSSIHSATSTLPLLQYIHPVDRH